MSWWIWLLLFIGALIVSYFYRRFSKPPLLEATISSPDGVRYKVSFEQKSPDMEVEEHIRLILGFAAKMLHIIDPRDSDQAHVQTRLLECIKKLSRVELDKKTNIISVCSQPVSTTKGEPSSGDKTIVATLYPMNSTERFVNTSIPNRWFEYQFLHSWLALVQETLPKLSKSQISLLKKSLEKMSYMYLEKEADYSSIRGLRDIPNKSFVGYEKDKY